MTNEKNNPPQVTWLNEKDTGVAFALAERTCIGIVVANRPHNAFRAWRICPVTGLRNLFTFANLTVAKKAVHDDYMEDWQAANDKS